MPEQTIDQQIEKLQGALKNWDLFSGEISRVRNLEMGTMFTPAVQRNEGYYSLQAIRGYQQIINAYNVLGNVTPEQSASLTKVSKVMQEMQDDQQALGHNPSPDAAKNFSARKMQELETKGEIYLATGFDRHANITRIAKTPDGGYTYTLYDAGGESATVRKVDGRDVVNALQENKIKPGANIAELIEHDIAKKSTSPDNNDYWDRKKAISKSLIDPPVRTEEEYRQRKGNCTTRGQRIMAADLLKDPKLSEGLYEFASNVQGNSAEDIKKALQEKLEYLKSTKDSESLKPENAWRSMEPESFAKAANLDNYEMARIPLDGGDAMMAYRTKPGEFSEAELTALKATLDRNGLHPAVRESMRQPGQFYLYVPMEETAKVGPAIVNDGSAAAAAYRKYGDNAREYVDVHNFAKASDAGNFEYADIPQNDGSRLEAYRTKPGHFTKGALDTLKETLVHQGVEADIRESIRQPGMYYLYVAEKAADQVPAALAKADSPAAKIVHQYGMQADTHFGEIRAAQTREAVMGMGVWKEVPGERAVFRLPTQDMDPAQVEKTMQHLKDLGFDPALRDSPELGQNIRLKNADAFKIYTMRNETIGAAKWEGAATDSGIISRVATKDMSPESVTALKNALAGKGIEAIDHTSSTLGETIRVRGDNVPKVMELHETHKGIALPAPVAMPPPLPSPVKPQLGPELPPKMMSATPPVEPPTLPVQKQVAPLVQVEQPPPPPVQKQATPPVQGVVAAVVAEEGISRFAPGGAGHSKVVAGVGAFGIAQAGMGLYDAVKTGDKVEAGISGVNLVTSTVATLEPALPALKGAGKFVPGLNVATVLADGAYQISKEDTTQHKEERAVATGVTAAVGIGLGTAAATTAESAAIAGVIGAGGAAVVTVAAPVVLTGVAVVAVAKTGDAVIQNKRAWDDLDRQIEESGVPKKRMATSPNADGKPSIIQYNHIVGALHDLSRGMQDGALTVPLQREQNGRMKIDQIRGYDMSDPKNLKEFERVLDARIAEDEKIAKENSSFMPRWLRFSDSLDKEENARMDLAPLKAARAELDMYKKELAEFDKTHPKQAAQSKFSTDTKPKDQTAETPATKPVSLQRPPRPPRRTAAAAQASP